MKITSKINDIKKEHNITNNTSKMKNTSKMEKGLSNGDKLENEQNLKIMANKVKAISKMKMTLIFQMSSHHILQKLPKQNRNMYSDQQC